MISVRHYPVPLFHTHSRHGELIACGVIISGDLLIVFVVDELERRHGRNQDIAIELEDRSR